MSPRSAMGAPSARRRRILFAPMSALALLGAASCGSQTTTSPDELEALLHDDPLTQVSVGALTDVPGGDGGVMTGSGGTTGSDGGMVAGGGGTVGAAGRGPAPTGAAGTGSPGGSGMAGTTGQRHRQDRHDRHRRKHRRRHGRRHRRHRRHRPGVWLHARHLDVRRLQHVPDQPGRQSFTGNTAFRSVSVACGRGHRRPGGRARRTRTRTSSTSPTSRLHFLHRRHRRGLVQPHVDQQDAHAVPQARRRHSSAFALVLNNGKYQFVVNLGRKAASIIAPTKAKATSGPTWPPPMTATRCASTSNGVAGRQQGARRHDRCRPPDRS